MLIGQSGPSLAFVPLSTLVRQPQARKGQAVFGIGLSGRRELERLRNAKVLVRARLTPSSLGFLSRAELPSVCHRTRCVGPRNTGRGQATLPLHRAVRKPVRAPFGAEVGARRASHGPEFAAQPPCYGGLKALEGWRACQAQHLAIPVHGEQASISGASISSARRMRRLIPTELSEPRG